MPAESSLYLQVAVPRRLHRVFTYTLPPDLSGPWLPGMLVKVPFGKSTLTGYIVAVTSEPETGGKRLRPVLARLDDTPSVAPDLLALAEWMAERYLAPLGQCLRLAFPGAPDERARKPTARLHPREPVPATAPPVPAEFPEALAKTRIRALDAVARGIHDSLLLPAATDSLLEFYGDVVQAVLAQGRQALILAPETVAVERLRRMFETRWGPQCAVYHGALSLAERRRAWARIRQGDVAVVLGTRSAVFAPLPRLGLIAIDQEDHAAYKAENVPRYDARVVAAERARRADAVMLSGSAHPSLEMVQATGWTADAFSSHGKPAPATTVVDLRETAFGDILSAPLTAAIEARLAARQGVLLFLNRKGFASVLICRDCGQAVQCPACSVGWTFHKHEGMLRCGYCGRTGAPPAICPACSGTRLFPTGSGTEALEDQVRERFPGARIARLERQRAGGERANAAILSLWDAGELDILVGTQLVITRYPRPTASLIGLVQPDAALHLPDFHAAERTYQTLSDVAALASVHDAEAEVIIQTHMPEHHVIRALAQHNPSLFYIQELADRKALGYPPFGRLIALRVTGTDAKLVDAAAARWAELLNTERTKTISAPLKGEGKDEGGFEILGPVPGTPAKVRGRFRWQLVVKGADGAALRQAVGSTLAKLEESSKVGGLRYDIDVDPQNLM